MRFRWCALLLGGVISLQAQAESSRRPDVVIDPGGVPPSALRSIVGAVDAITRLAEDQDLSEITRLRRRAYDATLSALQTEGYYAPKVTLEVGKDYRGETWDITIVPGERAKVDDVALRFTGTLSLPQYADRVDALREQWPLQKGMPFVNERWSTAKAELLDDVRRHDFYFARYLATQALVDPVTSTADLSLDVDSGPPVRLGPLSTEGLRRVPPKLIERYVRYSQGDAYAQDVLDDWQEALQSTTFFRGAFVTLDDSEQARRTLPDGSVQLPVKVQVSEAPARRATASLGADSDNGLRAEGLYRQNVVFGQPVWVETGAGVDKNRQRAFFDVHLPPTLDGYKDSVGLLFEHSDIQGVDNRRYGLGWNRRQERKAAGNSRVEYETLWSLVAAQDSTRISGGNEFRVPTVVGTWQWLRRNVDKKYDPREGNLIDIGLGAGVTLDTGKTFYRSSVRGQQWWPVGHNDVLTMRGEVGKVWTKTDRLPIDFGYRTGGARTIRGYAYNSIGRDVGDAVVGANALALASVEYTHYINEQFGVNFFVDAGDAADSFSQMKVAVGYGTGIAFRTPAGPFYVDLAYGQRDRQLRLHFSLGIAF
jgi:translocation and assembly module TamA